jgi:transcriptional regulator with XRE-family HTH domain
MALAGRLRAARDRLRWTREELAVRSGVSWSAIAQAESGRRQNLRPRTLSRLAGALGVSMDYLVTGQPSAPMLMHQALLYRGPQEFAEGAAAFLREGLERSEAGLAVTGKRNLGRLEKLLGRDSKRVELMAWAPADKKSPESALEHFTGFLAANLRRGSHWVRIVGEPPWDGRSPDEIRLWTTYESLINLIFAGSPMSVLCPYDLDELDPAILRECHATHPQVVTEGKPADSPDYRNPAHFVLDS